MCSEVISGLKGDADVATLILKRAPASCPSGEWNDDDYDVLALAAPHSEGLIPIRRVSDSSGIDRDRGGASQLRPSHTTVRTGPYTAVREVALTRLEQGWETERFEVRI
jgi:hypothetical protein